MAVLASRSDRVLMADITDRRGRETCDQLLASLTADFALMASFRRNNPRAQLEGPSGAWICPADGMFYVTLKNIDFCDAALATAEASEFGGRIAFVNNVWTLAVPLASRARWSGVGASISSALLLLLLLLVAAALFAPNHALRAAQRLWPIILAQLPTRHAA
jgi:hypothetical protein